MTPFLEYELLTPETADPVIIRITGQRERGFERFEAQNGVTIDSTVSPSDYYHYTSELYGGRAYPKLWVGNDNGPVPIPLADWPAVKQAIGELNESKKEKDMKEHRDNISMKEDRYYSLYGSWEQFDNFWDAVHYYANHSESRRSPVISSTPQYVQVKEEDYVVFATIVKASGLKHQKSPGPYVEAL